MAGIGPATSPLPRGCSATEPHGHQHRFGYLAEPKPVATRKEYLQPLEREAGIEPAYLAWKANVLPLNYSRLAVRLQAQVEGFAVGVIPLNRVAVVEEGGFEPP